MEGLWQKYFTDGELWWKSRIYELIPKSPDFRQPGTGGLWMDRWKAPKWVEKKASREVWEGRSLSGRNSYGACRDGNELHNRLPKRNRFTWTERISSYDDNYGHAEKVLRSYNEMRDDGAKPSTFAFVAALKACSSSGDLESGRKIHAHVVESGKESHRFVGTSLVSMYVKCGSLVDARHVFENLARRDVVSWNSMILGYAQNKQGAEALELFERMAREGVAPNARAYVGALKACSSLAAKEEGKDVDEELIKRRYFEKGKAMHSELMTRGFEADVFVGAALVDMYAKCGSMPDARHVFDKLPQRDVVSWSAMIFGYAQNEEGESALQFYGRMGQEGVKPDGRIFVGALKACGSLASLEEGREVDGKLVKIRCLEKGRSIHSELVKCGFESDVFVGNTLVDMYAKCGSMVDAQRVFDKLPQRDVVAWNAMILGYAQNEEGELGLNLFWQMEKEGVASDHLTFVGALKACSSLAVLEKGMEINGKAIKTRGLAKGKSIHSQLTKCGFEYNLTVGNTLMSMYAKCGSMVDARRVFDKLPLQDVVSWNAMILGYAQNEEGESALQLYRCMGQRGVTPDGVTFIGALKACGSLAALEEGMEIHSQIHRLGLDSFVTVAASLIDMYGKCGAMVDAQRVFDELPRKDLATWTALIARYACHGESEVVLNLYEKMKLEGIQPDKVTFVSVLSACRHAGLVETGVQYFEVMIRGHGIVPSIDHFICMVDLLGRAGLVHEAVAMVEEMPFQPNFVVWMTVLSACRKWNDVEIGRRAFESAVRLDKKCSAAYVLMLNIYKDACMWEDCDKIQAMQQNARAWKKPGQSWWADIGGIVHTFVAGDTRHSQCQYIYGTLKELSFKMEEGKG